MRSCDLYTIFNERLTILFFFRNNNSRAFFPRFFQPSLLLELGFYFPSIPFQKLNIVGCHWRDRQNGEHYGENQGVSELGGQYC